MIKPRKSDFSSIISSQLASWLSKENSHQPKLGAPMAAVFSSENTTEEPRWGYAVGRDPGGCWLLSKAGLGLSCWTERKKWHQRGGHDSPWLSLCFNPGEFPKLSPVWDTSLNACVNFSSFIPHFFPCSWHSSSIKLLIVSSAPQWHLKINYFINLLVYFLICILSLPGIPFSPLCQFILVQTSPLPSSSPLSLV